MVLEKELEIRARQKHTKLRKASKLPNKALTHRTQTRA